MALLTRVICIFVTHIFVSLPSLAIYNLFIYLFILWRTPAEVHLFVISLLNSIRHYYVSLVFSSDEQIS